MPFAIARSNIVHLVKLKERKCPMAKIVLGLAASHTPMLALEGKRWSERAADDLKNKALNLSDGRYVSYDELARENGAPYAALATEAKFLEIEAASQKALDYMADRLAQVAPDVVLIVGDDQAELFSLSNMPAISIFYGEEILTHERHLTPQTPNWIGTVMKGYAMDAVHTFPGCPELARELIHGLIENDVDIGAAAKVDDPHKAGFGHAYGFIIERLFKGKSIPVLPVLLNTYFPPNAPTARRAYGVGQAIASLISRSKLDARVAVVASGGLSHFVVDEKLDRKVLDAIKRKDVSVLKSLTRGELNSGSSELLNWVMVAGMSEHLDNDWTEYYPGYRTPAGTGTGIGFAVWS
ncbi:MULTISPECIES: extradiol ring-cleavage dioxygenase [Bradyrhizobium]|uniref:Extradiol ring-cleavage dioxygenase n=1 Tax=Bradyrhizobium zhengyangense TaxID=2911009 RepID=A0A9X1UH95_9BRAD|nr:MULTISPECIES: extradiol ring-cleavage dioxygenase [Bradyrhizobium]MCG2628217.1 extradiol ring-cleavage dioxygenase [Bradyrhizobium zhengyangense]MCG2643336.1 extradiol ring-cleavage dioxygenase [Bradyrhizobium zhengyangense]MCG2670350.1 extradiol ring-cleavage dioxygenase [Bradyrhizobium zhengyangense]MDN4985915.1 extradiol ring-cleavage dioxygenase [Bradyrhizobium sp. WYCCWR 13022]